MDENDVRKMQVAGVPEVDLQVSDTDEDPVRQKVNELEGISRTTAMMF